MGDAFGWTDSGRQVFDPKLLEEAAADLRRNNTAQELKDQLLAGLASTDAFGTLPNGPAAALRLSKVYESLQDELHKVGIDLADLASRALAAATIAHDVDPLTQAAAHRGHRDEMNW